MLRLPLQPQTEPHVEGEVEQLRLTQSLTFLLGAQASKMMHEGRNLIDLQLFLSLFFRTFVFALHCASLRYALVPPARPASGVVFSLQSAGQRDQPYRPNK